MTKWRETTLGDLVEHHQADVRTGPFGTQLHASDYTQTGVPVLNVRNLGYGGIRRVDVDLVDAAVQERLSTHILRENDIVFGRKGAVDRHALIRSAEAGWMQGSDCIRLRLGEGSAITPAFLSMALLTPTHKAWMEAQCSHGATMASLNQEIISRIQLSVPDLASQNRIAAVLAAFDELIAINERRIELLEDLARSLYREWFVRFRFPGAMPVELVDSEVGRIPAAWPVEALGSVCSFMKSGNTPRRSDPTNWENGTIDWFTTGELRDGPLTTSKERVASKPTLRLLEPPMILMAIYGSPTAHTCSCNQAALALRARNAPDAQEWLWHLLVSLRPHFNAMAQGAAQQNISKEKVANTFVAVPPPEILSRFAERAGPLRALSHELHAENARLAATRDLLLPRLVTGRLDISDVNLGNLLPAVTTA